MRLKVSMPYYGRIAINKSDPRILMVKIKRTG